MYGYCLSYDYEGNCITVTARGTVGFANLRDRKFCAIGRLLILRPEEKLECKFLAEYINEKINFVNESTGVPQLTAPQISKYEVIIPEYVEQVRISAILSDMDAEIRRAGAAARQDQSHQAGHDAGAAHRPSPASHSGKGCLRMNTVGQKEILTQKHVVQFFRDTLDYDLLRQLEGPRREQQRRRGILREWLKRQEHSEKIITKVLYELGKAKALGGGKNLYDANREVYGLLRYGVKVKPDVGEQNITVWLINWTAPAKNDFAIAEEVIRRRREQQAAGYCAVC